MASRRYNRLSEEIKRALSDIIRSDVKDSRISELMSITGVQVTEDLKFAKIYVSDYKDIDTTLIALESAKGFIKREIGKRVKMRIIPELIFMRDDSIERGLHISKLIDKVIEEDNVRKVNTDNAEE